MGTKPAWTGRIIRATTTRNRVCRPGNDPNAKAYAAIAPMPMGRMVDGTVIAMLLRNARPKPRDDTTVA